MNTLRTLAAWLPGVLLVLGIALLVNTALDRAYERGHTAGADSVQQRWNAERVSQWQQTAQLHAGYRAKQDVLQQQLSEQDQQHQGELARVEKEKTDFMAAVRSGRIRLSIPVASAACAPTGGSAASANPAPTGEPAEARAELAPAAGEALVAISDDGDAAIRDLNTCIDRYNTVRHTYHVQSP